MDRRLAIDDEAASQVLGFIVGMAVVTASLAIATYFITTIPNDSPDEESQQLQGDVQRAMDVLATTPGEPDEWHEDFDPDQLRRVGLLREGQSTWLDRDKIELIQRGELTGPRIMESWDLDPTERGMRIEGTVKSVPIGDTPIVDTYGVVHVPHVNGTPIWVPDAASLEAAGGYSQVNPGYTAGLQTWKFGVDKPPDQGLGNTVPDHAWYIETQLFPLMTGIEATYATADHGTGDWWNTDAVEQAMDDYTSETGNPESATRWHVIADNAPYSLPKTTADNGDHVLGVNWKMEAGNADKDNGVGKWRVAEGARTTALLGGFELGSANTATLSFEHLLKIETEDRNVCDEPYHEETETCRAIRPSILFWNTTAEPDRWTRIAEQGSPGCDPSGWNDTDTSPDANNWETAEVNLCEAVEHSEDKLWVSLFWDTSCLENGLNTTCQDENTFPDANKATHGWFVDNIELAIAGKTVYETDFEPPEGTEQQLFVSNGVDHNRTYHPVRDGAEANTITYLRHAVENGTSVVALAPDDPTPDDSTPGEWLSQLGLSSRDSTPSGEAATTDEPDSVLMRFPNELPKEAPDYKREKVSWQTGQPSTPNAWQLPTDFQPLTAVQTAGSDDATMMLGKPYPQGGGVAAIGYNHTSFDNETLRQELYENLYPSSVLIDPSFEVGDELPESGSSQVTSDRRVVIVSVTDDDRYVVPLEITTWLWNRG